jgi:hypothetical protein
MTDAKADPRDIVSAPELAVRCQRAVEGFYGLEDLLQPYVELWGELRAAKNKARPPGMKLTFWNFDGPHEYIDYTLRWDLSTMASLYFEGRDAERDTHTWRLPIGFIASESEAAARELAELKEKERLDAKAAEEERLRTLKERNRKARYSQYLALKEEFEREGQ